MATVLLFSYKINHTANTMLFTALNPTIGQNPEIRFNGGGSWIPISTFTLGAQETVDISALGKGTRHALNYRDSAGGEITIANFYLPIVSLDVPVETEVKLEANPAALAGGGFNALSNLAPEDCQVRLSGNAATNALNGSAYNTNQLPFYSSTNFLDTTDVAFAQYDRSGSSVSNPFPAPYVWTSLDRVGVEGSINMRTNIINDAIRLIFDTVFARERNIGIRINGTVTNVSINGGNDGAIDTTITGGQAPYTYAWSSGQNTEDISGLTVGDYTLTVTDANGLQKSRTFSVTQPEVMVVDSSKTDVTSNGGSDGTIQLTVTGGSGNYSFAWADDVGETTATRTDLAAGDYVATVTDTTTGQVVELTITINEPDPEVNEPAPYLEFPLNQSLRFVVQDAVDNCSIFEGLDNKLFCQQAHPFFQGLNYFQKVQTCDIFNIQFRSSYQEIEIALKKREDDSIVTTYTPQLVKELLGQTTEYDVRFQDNGDSQTRVYFVGSNTIPTLLGTGDAVVIFNSNNGIDGDYTIVNVLTDESTLQQYLLLNVDYNSVNPTETGELRVTKDVLPFNIYEFTLDFSSIVVGQYYITVTTQNNDESIQLVGWSEPIDVKVRHENTVFLQWANVDNAYDVDYSNNIVHRLRLEGSFFERVPASEDEGLRTIQGRYNLLRSVPRRRFRIRFFNLPPYLHENLFLAFKTDSIVFQGVPVTSEDGYEEAAYRPRYGLSNSQIVVEQTQWFSDYNSSDVGGVNTPSDAFIIANEGFIKR